MESGTYKTSDGLTLYTLSAPLVGAKGVVYIVHGIGEHIGRYKHVMQYLNGRGYAVFGHDHRGHGQSEGERVYFTSFEPPVRDLKGRIEEVKAAHPNLPFFILGHSMGSLISTLYVEHFGDTVDGWISSGSPLWVDQIVPSPVRFILRGVAAIAPRLPALPVDSKIISRDPDVVAAYDADPYVNHEKTRLGMIIALANAAGMARYGLADITIPTLVLHGTGDTLCPPAGSHALFTGISSEDKDFKTYEGLYHEVMNEPEQAEVLNDIGDWLDHQVSGETE